jgi:ABC-type bacteriocin/lantibiotic exporter with double-glycine peptidase domain
MISAPPVVAVANVPFYSQFVDVDSAKWKKNSCGVVSIAMIVDYYSDKPISVNTMLNQAIASGAYLPSAGWTHQGLINLSKKYGMTGKAYDLSSSSSKAAFATFSTLLKDGPIIASVHYKFEPTNPIPHLVVIDGIDKDFVYYNDPASTGGGKKISVDTFRKAWKQKFIVIRPVKTQVAVAPVAPTVALTIKEHGVEEISATNTSFFSSFFAFISSAWTSNKHIG